MRNQSIINKLNTFKKTTGSFNFNIGVVFILALLNVLYKMRITSNGIESADNLWNPMWLLLGPFTYFAFSSLIKKKRCIKYFSLHLLPFFIFALFYFIGLLRIDLLQPWANPLYVWYQNSFLIISFYIISYAVKIILNRKLINALQIKGELLLVICGFYIIIGVLGILMYLCWGILHIDMGIDYRIFTYAFLLMINIFILRYVYAVKFSHHLEYANAYTLDSSYTNSSLRQELAVEYVQKIMDYFSNDQSFLNPDISIELISKDLNIPKYHFSQLFNVHIGKNFYTFIAERRIEYALRRLNEEQGRLKIESLAHECGFNSKTSFNRYFKQITGCTPLVYLSKMEPVDTKIILAQEIK